MTIRALYVDDEQEAAEMYVENLSIALRDRGIDLQFDLVNRPEDAKSRLPADQSEYGIVFVDMMYELPNGVLVNRGEEVIAQAKKTNDIPIVVITQGDNKRPELKEELVAAGADVFWYKQSVQAFDRRTGLQGWDALAEDVYRVLRPGEVGPEPRKKEKPPVNPNSASDVFVVYGRDGNLRREFFAFLRSIGLKPMEWTSLTAAAVSSLGDGNPSVMSIIQQGFSDAHGGIVLLSGDDEARLREPLRSDHEPDFETELTAQPRQNVLFEAGYALGACPERTLLVAVGSTRPISDLGGMHIPRLTNSIESRQDIATRLRELGFKVVLDGTDWHSAGTFG